MTTLTGYVIWKHTVERIITDHLKIKMLRRAGTRSASSRSHKKSSSTCRQRPEKQGLHAS